MNQYHLSVQAQLRQHKDVIVQLHAGAIGSPQQLTLTQWQTHFTLWLKAHSKAQFMLNWQNAEPTWHMHFLADKRQIGVKSYCPLDPSRSFSLTQ